MTTKILFIDDENIVLHSCKRIFKNSGYNIDTASSGEEGLQKVRDNEYDIIVSDLKMPGIGGMEVLKTLRKEFPSLTVIIFTGYANVETAREALKNGAFDYIPKPFTPEEIRDVLENAVKSLEAREEVPMLDLMAIVSHELKSPVSVVHTTADTLHRGYFGKLGEGQKEIIETIIRNCEYLEDIIRSYIDLSKMELDQLDSFMEKLNLKDDVLEQALTVPEVVNNRKDMKINVSYDDDPSVCGDPRLLRIVFNNLINNAIKYGQEKTPIDVVVNIEDEKAVFRITNQGVGFSQDLIDNQLFTKFGRLRQRGTEGIKGSGLGLYICKKIIEKHSGTIKAESEVGSWAQFIVELPCI